MESKDKKIFFWGHYIKRFLPIIKVPKSDSDKFVPKKKKTYKKQHKKNAISHFWTLKSSVGFR